MDFSIKLWEGRELWLTLLCKTGRCGSVVLNKEQASAMLWMLDWHLETDAPGNFIEDEVGGLTFLSEGKGDLFAIGSAGVEISVPYTDCEKLRKVLRQAFQELDAPSSGSAGSKEWTTVCETENRDKKGLESGGGRPRGSTGAAGSHRHSRQEGVQATQQLVKALDRSQEVWAVVGDSLEEVHVYPGPATVILSNQEAEALAKVIGKALTYSDARAALPELDIEAAWDGDWCRLRCGCVDFGCDRDSLESLKKGLDEAVAENVDCLS